MKPDTRYEPCPLCGRPKRTIATTCKFCQRLPENVIDEIPITQDVEWIIEFSGLFWGEGSAMIIRNNSSYSPALVLRLRDDDHLMVEEIRKHLGGRLLHSYRHNYDARHGNMIEWRTTQLDHCEKICHLLLQYSTFFAKKKNDVEAVLSFCVWRKSLGRYLTPEQKEEAEFRLQALKESRLYSVVNVQG